MNSLAKLSFVSGFTLAGTALVVACSSGAEPETARGAAQDLSAVPVVPSGCNRPKKAIDGRAQAQCYSLHLDSHVLVHPAVDLAGKAATTPPGFGPADLQAAYAIPASLAPSLTVAVVDAQDNPNAEKDLAVYRSQFGLPACTTANGCFKKVNQEGAASPLPAGDTDWGGEIALDLDMVSAICPSCKILLVEANSQADTDLAAGVDLAASLGAAAISNSYGWLEDGNSTADATHYSHAGVFITASSGDSQLLATNETTGAQSTGPSFPAVTPTLTAVGGTALKKDSSARGWTETVWENSPQQGSGTGSGCSTIFAQPSFQTKTLTGCAKRAEADVSAVADPATGVAIYDTYGGSAAGAAGWEVYGGTSAASPIVASLVTRIGKASTMTNAFSYANPADFYDVTSGSTGSCSSDEPICNAGPGWDGPTGNGTPNAAAIAGAVTPPPVDAGTDSGTSDAGKDSGVDAGKDSGAGDTCSHDVCDTGSKLTAACDACATAVCASDSYCCKTKWDDICVSEVGDFCAAGTTTCN
jgi:hypothetical protein